MPYKINVFSGTLDYYKNFTGAGTGNVTGIPPTTDKAIVRWVGVSGDTIEDSKAIIQDGGAIQTQGILQKRNIDEDVTVPDNYVWIDQDMNLTTGTVTCEGDGEITLVD